MLVVLMEPLRAMSAPRESTWQLPQQTFQLVVYGRAFRCEVVENRRAAQASKIDVLIDGRKAATGSERAGSRAPSSPSWRIIVNNAGASHFGMQAAREDRFAP